MTTGRPHARKRDRDALIERGLDLVVRANVENLLAEAGDPDAIERRDSLLGSGMAWWDECVAKGLLSPDYMRAERRKGWAMFAAQMGMED